MSLKDLNETLHSRDAHMDRAREHVPYDPLEPEDKQPVIEFTNTEEWKEPEQKRSPFEFLGETAEIRRKRVALVLGGMALIALMIGAVVKIRSALFDESNVGVSISGPKSTASAEMVTFSIHYENKNWGSLENALLVVSYPDAFRLEAAENMNVSGTRVEIPLGSIARNTQGKTQITGKFYGSRGDLVTLKAVLRYSPHNVSSVLEKETQFGVSVGSSPLFLEISAPLEMATGQDVEYVVDYANRGDVDFSNLRVKMEYPEGFHFVSAEPRPSEGDSVWYAGNMQANASGKIVIRGVMTGVKDEYKRITGMAGFFQGDGKFIAYTDNTRQTKIIASPLSVIQTVNGLKELSARLGDKLSYVINYRNDGDLGLRDVIITAEIDPTFLDVSSLSIKNGAYDAARKLIVWKASDVPELARLDPGEQGQVSFTVRVPEIPPQSIDKNFSVRSVAKIDSPDIPTPIGSNKVIGSNTMYVKLQSVVRVGTSVYYTDDALPNTGPIPPRVGEETTYTIRVKTSNLLNDVTQSRLSLLLPTGVKYTGQSLPRSETVHYNERSNEMDWEIGTLLPGDKNARELAFQISVTPQPNQVGKNLILVNSLSFSGKDSYTGEDAKEEKEAVENQIPNDKVYGNTRSEVLEAATTDEGE